MNRFLRATIPIGALLLFGNAAPIAAAAEPRNLDLLKQEIRSYVSSADYGRDIAHVAAEAKAWIEERAAKRTADERLAVVLDLDETLLSNWPAMDAMGLGYVPAQWKAWVDQGQAPAIEPVRALYRQARALGLEVFFITGRTERDRAGTEKNLRAIECGEYTALICRPEGARETAASYKTKARQRLVEDGVTIIANVGDQQSDLAGGAAERTFKLPNPFYLSE